MHDEPRQPDPRAMELIIARMKAWFESFEDEFPSPERVREHYRAVYNEVMGSDVRQPESHRNNY